jgi:glutathione reductase (NADPH)
MGSPAPRRQGPDGQEQHVTSAFDFDLFVIGGGSGGVRASRFAASFGARVAMAESDRLGGTCVNVGCVPKKLFVYGADVPRQLAGAPGLGWTVEGARFDWPTLRARTADEVRRLNGVYERTVSGAGAEIIRGRARLVSPQAVEVREAGGATRVVTARHVLVATGARPRRPSIPGAELGLVSDDLFTLERLPASLVIVGAGYIGLEFAGIFAALGVEVTVLARHDHLLPRFDRDVSLFVRAELEKAGIRVACHEEAARIESVAGRRVVTTERGHRHEAEAVLLAVGRDPATEGLGLEEVGVVLRGGAVRVDSHYTTSVPSVHAVGDVIGHVQLTPVALAEGMAVARTLFGEAGPQTVDYDRIPTAVFTAPAVGTVGLSESEARARAHRVAVFKTDFKPMKHTLTGATGRTFMKLVVDLATDRVLGVHVVGDEAGEIVQGFAVALTCGATKAQLDATIGIHPTAAEELVTMRTAASIDPE